MFKNHIFLLGLFACFGVYGIQSIKLFQKRVIQMSYLRGYCKDENENMLISFKNISIKSDKTRKTLMNTTIVITEDIPKDNNHKVTGIIKKCKTKDSPDSCLSIRNLSVKLCTFIKAKDQLWSPFFAVSEPSMPCPLKKGEYVITNGYFDPDAFPFPVDPSDYLQCLIIFGSDKNKLGCVYGEGKVVPIKNAQ